MSRWKIARIRDFCDTGSGGTPPRDKAERYYEGGTIPWVKSGELREAIVTQTEECITEAALKETAAKLIPAGAILIAMYGATVGRLGILGVEAATNQAICHIIPDPKCAEPRYLFHALQAQATTIIGRGVGGAQPNISQQKVKELLVPLPPISEQRRIADILDKADTLRAKRRAALAQLDALSQSIFLDMFGDPATNPKRWQCQPLANVALKFSDGPFGSNLKTEHYVETGIRVVRLQNIGVGDFIDDDRAYISPDHFVKLRKHECIPGDVLVGTLGDPNLRACILPAWLPIALNKADCVQLRPNTQIANAEYLSALLNCPSTERMASGLALGQTRIRISMGRLRGLKVPIPPLAKQREFSEVVAAIGRLKLTQVRSLEELDVLFSALQHRAFGGKLTADTECKAA